MLNYFALEREATEAYTKAKQPKVDLKSYINGYVEAKIRGQKNG